MWHQLYCFCICELSVVIFAVCEKSVVTRDSWQFVVILGLSYVMITPCRSHYTIPTPRSEWVVINHVSLNLSYRVLPGLWSGSHTSRLPQLICVILVVRVVEATDVLEIVCWILGSYKLMPAV